MAGTQAINRALHLLKLFDDDHPTWELNGLADASGLNKTTAFRIVGALEDEGLVERTASGAYRLGSELIALGGRAARANDLRRAAAPHLMALTGATGETTTLEVLRGDDTSGYGMLVIDEVLGTHLVGITQYIGSRLPVHLTSTGRAVLAYKPEPLGYLLGPPSATADGLPWDAVAFERALATVRACGYAVVRGELERGLIAVGAPIFGVDGGVRAAISLLGPSVRVGEGQIDGLSAQVQAVAARISYQIGYRDGVQVAPASL